MQLIVLGMHRSGTSVLARLLNMMGAWFGPEGMSTGAKPENPKGFWERRDVRKLSDDILHAAGCDWNRVASFDQARIPEAALRNFRARAAEIVLEMDAHRPWLLKEPRLCLLMPLWRPLLEVPVCLHVFRHPVEVASSLHKRNGMPVEAGLALWETYVRGSVRGAAGLPALGIVHGRLMHDPVGEVARLLKGLEGHGVQGLRMPAESEINAFVRQDLHRERAREQDLEAWAETPQVSLFEALASAPDHPGEAIDAAPAASADASHAVLVRYEATLGPIAATSGKQRTSTAEPGNIDGEVEHLRQTLRFTQRAMQSRFDEIATLTGLLVRKEREWEQLKRTAATSAADAARWKERANDETVRADQEAARATREAARAIDAGRWKKRAADEAAKAARESARTARMQTLAEERALQAARLRKQLQAAVSGQRAASANAARAMRQLASIRHSAAWRLAAPVRLVSRALARLRGRADDAAADVGEIRHSPLFDATWYADHYPDVVASGLDPARHYLEHGAWEGRNPGPDFDSEHYLALYPDVAGTGMNPLLHFIRHGQAEGRSTRPAGHG